MSNPEVLSVEEETAIFASDEKRRAEYFDSEAYSRAVEKVPFCRMWCLVEMAAAIE
jgi:hypothetical protein